MTGCHSDSLSFSFLLLPFMAYGISFSPQTKSVLILLATLLLGALLGAVLTGWWVQQRFDRVRALRTADGFVERVVQQVEPTSAAQRDSVRVIARKRAQQLQRLRGAHRADTRAVLDSLREDLRPVLTEEQIAQLERRLRGRGRDGEHRRSRPRHRE